MKKPDVVIILTDDQGYGDLGFMGSKDLKTPNLDALAEKAREGVRTCLILDHYGCAQHMEEKGHRLRMKPFRNGCRHHASVCDTEGNGKSNRLLL